jgi:large repetitive protein
MRQLAPDEQNKVFSISIAIILFVCVVAVVLFAAAPLTIVTSSLPAATVGKSYSAQLVGSGGAGTYQWSGAGALPAGVKLNTSGSFSGAPSSAGAFPITITLRGVRGSTTVSGPVSKAFTITVGGVVGTRILTASPTSLNFGDVVISAPAALPAAGALAAASSYAALPAAGDFKLDALTIGQTHHDGTVTHSVILNWGAWQGATGYDISRGASCSTRAKIASVDEHTYSFTDKTVAPGPYCYVVAAEVPKGKPNATSNPAALLVPSP